MFEERTYRKRMQSENLVSFIVVNQESDLFVLAEKNLETETKDLLKFYRNQLIEYGSCHPDFTTSFEPTAIDDNAPPIIQHMQKAGMQAEVGPMAAVAGAISEYIGKELLKVTEQVIIENGGDIFIGVSKPKNVLIDAGNSPFSNRLLLQIDPQNTPLGICTSSGKVGHSISFGNADAVVVVSKDTLLADAYATKIGNMIRKPEDIPNGLDYAKNQIGIMGIIIIIGDQLGVWGAIKFVEK